MIIGAELLSEIVGIGDAGRGDVVGRRRDQDRSARLAERLARDHQRTEIGGGIDAADRDPVARIGLIEVFGRAPLGAVVAAGKHKRGAEATPALGNRIDVGLLIARAGNEIVDERRAEGPAVVDDVVVLPGVEVVEAL